MGEEMTTVHHRYATVKGQRLFYQEAGPAEAPAVVLLHGFPASSFMFRGLIPRLADRYRVIAPDHLGFGLSDAPPAGEFGYTFDALAGLTADPLGQLGVSTEMVDLTDETSIAGLGERLGVVDHVVTAAWAQAIMEADRIRAALRAPASARAAVGCLRPSDIHMTAEDHDELLQQGNMPADQPAAVPSGPADTAFRSLYAEHGPALLRQAIETARVMQIPPGTVRSRTFYGLRAAPHPGSSRCSGLPPAAAGCVGSRAQPTAT
jgi:hypothetical protein